MMDNMMMTTTTMMIMMVMVMITAPASYCNGPPISKGHPKEDQEDKEDGSEDGRQGIVPDGNQGFVNDGGVKEDEKSMMLFPKQILSFLKVCSCNICIFVGAEICDLLR